MGESKMAATVKDSESEAQVTLEGKQKDLENLQDAEEEILMLDDEEGVPYQIGELFVNTTTEESTELIEKAKGTVQAEIAKLESQADSHKIVLSELKVQLYAKFGNNINLEAEE